MATPREHKEKALHNERLLDVQELTGGEFVDWAVTVLFYGALHWMRALAAQAGYEIKAYRSYRKGIVGEEEVFKFAGIFTPQAFGWYSHLKDESRDARYEMRQFSITDFRDLRQNFFEPFRSFVTSRLRA
jgi:hypothetical protein